MKPSGRPLVTSKRSNKPKKAKRGSQVQVPTTPPRQVGKEQPTVTPGMLADMVPETPPKLASGVQERAVDRVEEPVDLPAASTANNGSLGPKTLPGTPSRKASEAQEPKAGEASRTVAPEVALPVRMTETAEIDRKSEQAESTSLALSGQVTPEQRPCTPGTIFGSSVDSPMSKQFAKQSGERIERISDRASEKVVNKKKACTKTRLSINIITPILPCSTMLSRTSIEICPIRKSCDMNESRQSLATIIKEANDAAIESSSSKTTLRNLSAIFFRCRFA